MPSETRWENMDVSLFEFKIIFRYAIMQLCAKYDGHDGCCCGWFLWDDILFLGIATCLEIKRSRHKSTVASGQVDFNRNYRTQSDCIWQGKQDLYRGGIYKLSTSWTQKEIICNNNASIIVLTKIIFFFRYFPHFTWWAVYVYSLYVILFCSCTTSFG